MKVGKISKVTEKGFCCPITEAGTIMVNGILTSCYANLSDIRIFEKMFISAQTVGKIGFAPFTAYRKISKDKEGTIIESDEFHPYVAFLFKIFSGLIKY